MEEIEENAKLCLVGKLAKRAHKGQPKVLVLFEVWLNSYNHDIDLDITNQFTNKQLDSLKQEFISKHDEKEESFTQADDESRGCDAHHYAAEERV